MSDTSSLPTLALTTSLRQTTIYPSSPASTDDIENKLTIRLANQGVAIQGGSIELTLERGSEPGDVTPLVAEAVPDVGQLRLAITDNDGRFTWGDITGPMISRGGRRLSWSVGSTGGTLLPAGGKVEFTFTRVASVPASGESRLHVTLQGMDNYASVTYPLLIPQRPVSPPEISSFEGRIEPVAADPGSTGVPTLFLNWATGNVHHCCIEGAGVTGRYEPNPEHDAVKFPLANLGQTEYTLTAYDSENHLVGWSVSKTVRARLVSAEITALRVTPAAITAGSSAVLAWATTGAKTVKIDSGVGPVAFTGSLKLTPGARNTAYTITYTLTAEGLMGSVTRPVILTVKPQAKITSLGIGDYNRWQPKVRVDWTTQNATRVHLTLKEGGTIHFDRDVRLKGSIWIRVWGVWIWRSFQATLTVWEPARKKTITWP